MKVVFRVDASVLIGTGHLMRCLTLAEALHESGVQVCFVSRGCDGDLGKTLKKKAMSVVLLPELNGSPQSQPVRDSEQTVEVLNGEKPDWLVVDHYALDLDWEQRLRPHVGKMMVIDDLANRHHDCDMLLDQNYSVENERNYSSLVPPLCKVLLGPSYALLRKDFRVMRENRKPRSHKIENVLVFFTAGNDQGETLKAMQGVEFFGKAERVDVVVGQFTPRNNEIMKRCIALGWGYHRQVDYMPALIEQADIVIGAGGASSWERCALGVPALVAILAENQAPIAQALDRVGAVCNLGWGRDIRAEDYASALTGLSCQRLAAMSEKASELVDANGALRVTELLLSV